MDYESSQFECDLWQGTIVLTEKATRRCGSVHLVDKRRRQNGAQMLAADVKKYGSEKALATYAKLVENWQ
jgi:hypothetical protein